MNIPLIAYGTWVEHLHQAPSMLEHVKQALRVGYTHIDTAQNYGTEPYVFQAIRESGITRDKIFLTSKVASPGHINHLRNSLGDLGYYDLLLLHYPIKADSAKSFKFYMRSLWIGMQEYINSGVAKAIGVSNFYPTQLELLLEICLEEDMIPPIVNQIEIHPGNLELDFVPYMQSQGVIPFAHTPLGGLGSQYVLSNEILSNIGTRIGATPAQVILAYLLKRGIGVVTRSTNVTHMTESIHSTQFIEHLTETDMVAINSTEAGLGPMIESSQRAWEQNVQLR